MVYIRNTIWSLLPNLTLKFQDKYHESLQILGSGFLGGSMGLIDGVCTWSLYKLSGESISERWARELESIHNQNIAEVTDRFVWIQLGSFCKKERMIQRLNLWDLSLELSLQ